MLVVHDDQWTDVQTDNSLNLFKTTVLDMYSKVSLYFLHPKKSDEGFLPPVGAVIRLPHLLWPWAMRCTGPWPLPMRGLLPCF